MRAMRTQKQEMVKTQKPGLANLIYKTALNYKFPIKIDLFSFTTCLMSPNEVVYTYTGQ